MTQMDAIIALDPMRPITPQVAQLLRDRIIRNALKPGNRISETEIAKTYDISRQPVREAFIKLQEQGLLQVLPQRGTIISRIAYQAVLDARFLREAIEADIGTINLVNDLYCGMLYQPKGTSTTTKKKSTSGGRGDFRFKQHTAL